MSRRHARSGAIKIAMQQVLCARRNGCFVAMLIDPQTDTVMHEIPLVQMQEGDVFELQIAWKKDEDEEAQHE